MLFRQVKFVLRLCFIVWKKFANFLLLVSRFYHKIDDFKRFGMKNLNWNGRRKSLIRVGLWGIYDNKQDVNSFSMIKFMNEKVGKSLKDEDKGQRMRFSKAQRGKIYEWRQIIIAYLTSSIVSITEATFS